MDEESEATMRKLAAMLALWSLTACAGERAPAGSPAADSLTTPRADSASAQPRDSTTRREDSVMVRDTAKGV
jgi:predicted small lipoprotein YifL